MPILAILLAAVLVGYLLGGRLRRFEDVKLHWWGLAILGLAMQTVSPPALLGLTERGAGAVALLVSYALLLAFLAVNRWVPAAKLMALGLFLNLVVVGLNGGMPVTARAIELAGGEPAAVNELGGSKHHLATDEDVLVLLGDTIPIPEPIGIVISIGDVLLYGGMAWFVIQVMRGRSRENPRPMAMWFLSYRGKHAPSYWRIPARYRDRDRAEAAPSGTGP